jgi:hypothetical protein
MYDTVDRQVSAESLLSQKSFYSHGTPTNFKEKTQAAKPISPDGVLAAFVPFVLVLVHFDCMAHYMPEQHSAF